MKNIYISITILTFISWIHLYIKGHYDKNVEKVLKECEVTFKDTSISTKIVNLLEMMFFSILPIVNIIYLVSNILIIYQTDRFWDEYTKK